MISASASRVSRTAEEESCGRSRANASTTSGVAVSAITISTVAGRVGEVLNLAAPRLMDAAMAVLDARMPDSPAARGQDDGRDVS